MKNSNFTGSYGYRLDVEGLRGLAVLAVVFYHMGLSFFEGGFVGVDVFFVISGYLITRTIIFDVQNANFSVLEFYNKRARKILPSLFVVVVVSLIVGAMVMPPEPYQSMSKSALSALLFLSNFYLQSEVNYFDAAAELKPLLHTWSLAIEEQFYIVIPLVIAISGSLKIFVRLVVLFVVISMSLFFYVSTDQSKLFFFPQYRMWELGVGVLCAFYERGRVVEKGGVVSYILAHLGLVGILFSFAMIEPRNWPNISVLLPATCSALILLNLRQVTLLQNRLLGFIGRRSYSIYLVHYPVISLSYYFVGTSLDLSQTLLQCLLISILSFLLYHYVEQRYVKSSRDISSRLDISPAINAYRFVGILLFIIVFTSGFGIETDGYWLRTDADKLKKIASSIKREHIECVEGSAVTCINKAPNAKVVIIGDSNAYHFAVGAASASPNHEVISLALGGCLPLASFRRLEQSNSYNESCIRFNKEVDEVLTSDFSNERTVVVSAAWLLYLYGDDLYRHSQKSKLATFGHIVLGDEVGLLIPKERRLEEFNSYLIELVKKLSSKFRHVVILGPLPPQPYAVRVEQQIQFNGHNGIDERLFYSYASPLLNVFKEIEDLKISNLLVIYPHKKLCDALVKNRCVGFVDGVHYYGDETHVSAVGQYVAYSELFDYLRDLDRPVVGK